MRKVSSKVFDVDTYLCTVDGDDKVVVNGKGEIIE